MFQYLRTVKDIDYNRNQSKKSGLLFFFLKKAIYTAVKNQ